MTAAGDGDRNRLDEGWDELRAGRWQAARACFSDAVESNPIPRAFEGLSWAAWWLDDAEALFVRFDQYVDSATLNAIIGACSVRRAATPIRCARPGDDDWKSRRGSCNARCRCKQCLGPRRAVSRRRPSLGETAGGGTCETPGCSQAAEDLAPESRRVGFGA
jgi:hypothetical protein